MKKSYTVKSKILPTKKYLKIFFLRKIINLRQNSIEVKKLGNFMENFFFATEAVVD